VLELAQETEIYIYSENQEILSRKRRTLIKAKKWQRHDHSWDTE